MKRMILSGFALLCLTASAPAFAQTPATGAMAPAKQQPAPMGMAAAKVVDQPAPAAMAAAKVDAPPAASGTAAASAKGSERPGSVWPFARGARADRKDRRDSDRYGPDGRHRNPVEIAVPIAFFLMVVLLVGLIQLASYRRDRIRHETLRVMVERGAEIPMALLSPRKRRPASDLRRGVIWLCVGLGTMAALAILAAHEENHPWAIGLVPTLIGIGYLVVWKIEARNGNGEPAPALMQGTLPSRPVGRPADTSLDTPREPPEA